MKRPLPEFRAPIIRADDLNALRAEVVRLAGLTVAGDDLALEDGAGGPQLSTPKRPRVIDAKITGTTAEPGRTAHHALAGGAAAYSWVQVDPQPDGSLPTLAGGLAGFSDRDPAVERDGNGGAPANSHVRLLEGPAYVLADGVPSAVWWFGRPVTGRACDGALVSTDVVQSLPNNAETVVTFAQMMFGLLPYWVYTQPTRVTIPPSIGTTQYHFGATVGFAANAAGYRQIRIRVNGVAYLAGAAAGPSPGTGVTTLSCSTIATLFSGDYLEVMAYQNSGGALNIDTIKPFTPSVWLFNLGPLGP